MAPRPLRVSPKTSRLAIPVSFQLPLIQHSSESPRCAICLIGEMLFALRNASCFSLRLSRCFSFRRARSDMTPPCVKEEYGLIQGLYSGCHYNFQGATKCKTKIPRRQVFLTALLSSQPVRAVIRAREKDRASGGGQFSPYEFASASRF